MRDATARCRRGAEERRWTRSVDRQGASTDEERDEDEDASTDTLTDDDRDADGGSLGISVIGLLGLIRKNDHVLLP